MLQDLLHRGYDGWVLYIDADAYVYDLDFDVRGYLHDKDAYALIAAGSGSLPNLYWNVNNGVFFLNLANPVAAEIVSAWAAAFSDISDDSLRAASAWGDVPHDQDLLQRVLRERPSIADAMLVDHHGLVINSPNAKFIRQIMRSHQRDFEVRVNEVEEAVQGVFAKHKLNPKNIVSKESI